MSYSAKNEKLVIFADKVRIAYLRHHGFNQYYGISKIVNSCM